MATLKIAKKRGVKTIVLVRNPLDAVSSDAVRAKPGGEKQRIESTQRLLADHIDSYRYVKANQDHCRILDFETVTKAPERLVTEVVRLGVMEPKGAEAVRTAAATVESTLRAPRPRVDRVNIGGPQRERERRRQADSA